MAVSLSPVARYTVPAHKPDFPTQSDLSDFLREVSEKPDGIMSATGLPYHTVEKWFRAKPSEMSAVNLVRVLLATGSEARFSAWLGTFKREGKRYSAPPLPATALSRVAEPSPLDEKKRRTR